MRRRLDALPLEAVAERLAQMDAEELRELGRRLRARRAAGRQQRADLGHQGGVD